MANVSPDHHEVVEAATIEEAVALLMDDGADEASAWQIAAIDRSVEPGDAVNLDEWPELT